MKRESVSFPTSHLRATVTLSAVVTLFTLLKSDSLRMLKKPSIKARY